jgi:hypothetical protein
MVRHWRHSKVRIMPSESYPHFGVVPSTSRWRMESVSREYTGIQQVFVFISVVSDLYILISRFHLWQWFLYC